MKLAEDLGRSLVTEEQSQLLLCVMGRVPRGLEASLVNVLIKCNAMAQPQKHCDCSQHRCSLFELSSDFPRGASQKSGMQKVFFRPLGCFALRQGAQGCHECLHVASSLLKQHHPQQQIQHFVQNQ